MLLPLLSGVQLVVCTVYCFRHHFICLVVSLHYWASFACPQIVSWSPGSLSTTRMFCVIINWLCYRVAANSVGTAVLRSGPANYYSMRHTALNHTKCSALCSTRGEQCVTGYYVHKIPCHTRLEGFRKMRICGGAAPIFTEPTGRRSYKGGFHLNSTNRRVPPVAHV